MTIHGTSEPAPGEDHRAWDELAVGWAVHALEPEDEDRFSAHLPGCGRCAATVADTQQVMGALAADLPAAEPSDALRDRLRAAVEETEQVRRADPAPARQSAPPAGPPAGPPVPAAARTGGRDLDLVVPRRGGDPDLRPAWRRVLPTALVAAAVAAVLALGAWNVLLAGDRDAARAVAAQRSQVLDELLVPGRATIAPLTEEDGRQVATVVARDGQVQVLSTGLAPNDPTDTTYVVWGVAGDTPVAIGEFDVETPQMELQVVGSAATGLDEYGTYAISIEPGRQAPSEPTEIVANGQVTS
ncbi:anti-sigma factor domain-containing protein [Modestobacter roseus]|uniref:Regulator of SigK n=1 Tax=Modestobacter roseus TaxID=1181884 RepID=A0A562IN63_9ACTN|nr:anti-sigma factor [Modestobacter roseus]MQA36023.1 anti-sigma factor [Modestobacter roseus]TWH72457.1 anti-sigma-K factor rskA [Modestobacter roseus]